MSGVHAFRNPAPGGASGRKIRIPFGSRSIAQEGLPLEAMPAAWHSAHNKPGLIAYPNTDVFLAALQIMAAQGISPDTIDMVVKAYSQVSYPNWEVIAMNASHHPDASEARKLIVHAKAVHDRFGGGLPASLYEVMLDPIKRPHLHHTSMLRMERPQNEALWLDAALHAVGKVYPLMSWIQADAARFGWAWRHSCDCNHDLAEPFPTPSIARRLALWSASGVMKRAAEAAVHGTEQNLFRAMLVHLTFELELGHAVPHLEP